jgi:hypothetical protein
MELIAQDTRGIKELRAIRDAIRATTNPVRPPGSPAALIQVFPDGADLGRLHTLGAGPVVVGRGEGLGVKVNDLSVSRAHARLELHASGRLAVTDLGSANGTFINDTLVRTGEACEGDFVRFGGCAFRFLAATALGL